MIPEGFDEYQFWPLGLNGRPKWPFLQKRDRVLVVSPFVADGFLSRLLDKVDRPHESVLISRPEELCALSQSVRQSFGQTLVLSSTVQSEEEVREASLSGLHAKLFIAEPGMECARLGGLGKCWLQTLRSTIISSSWLSWWESVAVWELIRFFRVTMAIPVLGLS